MPGPLESRRREAAPEPPVLGWLQRRDFERARRVAPEFSAWSSYRDFLAERDALFLGYGSAGLSPKRQLVAFDAFERWARLTGAPLSLDGLDAFAAHARWRERDPNSAVMGRFGACDHPERHSVDDGGVQCVRIRPEIFVRWRDDFARARLLPPPSLDDYAAHIVEFCLFSEARARGPAVSSA